MNKILNGEQYRLNTYKGTIFEKYIKNIDEDSLGNNEHCKIIEHIIILTDYANLLNIDDPSDIYAAHGFAADLKDCIVKYGSSIMDEIKQSSDGADTATYRVAVLFKDTNEGEKYYESIELRETKNGKGAIEYVIVGKSNNSDEADTELGLADLEFLSNYDNDLFVNHRNAALLSMGVYLFEMYRDCKKV